ncbi:MAG: hypothetical protein A2014_01845 [Spirochaetes bacterium GWF1_49_6]|nr:MAG: hypothetical protein A2014_01845 [Spirochaetes bacterium GWF1_49_6]
MKRIVFFMAILGAVLLSTGLAFSDGGGNKTLSKTLQMYKNCVPVLTVTGVDVLKSLIEGKGAGGFDENLVRLTRLSKDKIEDIAAYYKGLMGKSDKLTKLNPGQDNEYRSGYSIVYNDADGNELGSVEIYFTDIAEQKKTLAMYMGGDDSSLDYALMPFPMIMMKMQIGMYGHTQKEFDALKAQYGSLNALFYRSSQKDMDDEMANDSDKIMLLAYQKLMGANKKMTPKQFNEWMQTQGMAAAMQMNKKEAWGIWSDCLKELDKAGYPIQIIHTGSTLWK